MGKGYSPEQIVRKLQDAEARLAAGSSIPKVARDLGISNTTFHRWRKKYGGMSSSEAKRLKELEKENTRLKKLVAEQALDIDLLKEVSRKTSEPGPGTQGGGACAEEAKRLRAPSLPGRRPG